MVCRIQSAMLAALGKHVPDVTPPAISIQTGLLALQIKIKSILLTVTDVHTQR